MITDPRSPQEEMLYQAAAKHGFEIKSRDDFDRGQYGIRVCLVFEIQDDKRDSQPRKYLRVALVKGQAEIGLVRMENPCVGKQIIVNLADPESQNMIDAYFDPNNTETI